MKFQPHDVVMVSNPDEYSDKYTALQMGSVMLVISHANERSVIVVDGSGSIYFLFNYEIELLGRDA